MNRLRKVISNTVVSIIGQIITTTSTLLLTIAYGRYLGGMKFGELYFATIFVLLIGFPIELGFNQQLTRDVAIEPDRARRYFSNTLLLKGSLWLILYSFVLLFCWLLHYSSEERVLVAICGFTLLSNAITNTYKALYIAYEQIIFSVVGDILEKGLSALIGILLLEHGGSVQAMAFVLLGASFVNILWQTLWFLRITGGKFVFDKALIRKLLHTSVPFMMYGALTVVYFRLDTVLLSLMTTVAIVGWYGAGYRLFETMTFLSNLVINAVMYPVFSKLYVSSEARLKLAVEKSLNFLLFLGLPMSIGMIVTAPAIVGFLYHRAEFSHSVPALQGLAPGLVFLYANAVFSSVIISTKREKKITIMAAIALVFNLGLNLFLIPLFQHVGAAIVTSLTELLLLCLSMIFVPKHLLPLGSLKVAVKATAASFVMVLGIWLLGTLHIVNFFAILPIAMLVYFATATLFRTVPKEDIRALYTALRQKVQVSSTQSHVKRQETAVMNIVDQPTEPQNALFTQVQNAHDSLQEIQLSFPEMKTPVSFNPISKRELVPEDRQDLSNTYAQTETRLEVPRWFPSCTASSDATSNSIVQRWQEKSSIPEQNSHKDD